MPSDIPSTPRRDALLHGFSLCMYYPHGADEKTFQKQPLLRFARIGALFGAAALSSFGAYVCHRQTMNIMPPPKSTPLNQR